MNKTHFLKLGLVAFTVIAILSFPVLAKDDTQNGKLQNEKIRLLSVSDTPDPFSPKVTSVSFTGNFEVKRTDGLGSESEEKKFRFFIRHTWIIIDSKTNQEINRLVGEIDIVAPPKGKAGYFPVTVSKSWDGTDCQSNIVSDGIYQYSVSGELYREKISKEKNDKEPPLKLIGYSEFLNGTITLDNSSPSITDLTPIPDSILNNARPVISAKYSDGLSGVDIASVKLTLDNVDITDSAEVTESGIVFNTANPLTDGLHLVIIELKDKAGNSTRVSWSFLTDITAPEINNLSPADKAIINNPKPIISVDYSDTTSGIDINTIKVILDGVDITDKVNITENGLFYTPSENLSDGSHNIKVEVKDNAGNLATVNWSFTSDITPPIISNPIPLPDSYTKITKPTISAEYSDNLSGIDITTAKITLDNIDYTASAQITETKITFTPTDVLSEGQHTVTVDISEKAGNPAIQLKWSFMIDSVLPTLVVINPADNSTINTNTPEIVISYSDRTSGINRNKFSVLINGVDKTASFTLNGTKATYQIPPAEKLPEGINSITAQIEDMAGNIGLVSSVFTVTTGPVDTIPPEVWIEYPTSRNQPEGKTIAVTVKAQDNVAVTKVTLFANGQEIGFDTETPYQFNYTIPTGTAGQTIELVANAENHVGNIGNSAPVRIPITSITSGVFALEVTGVPNPVVAGTPLNITVRAIDKNGNTATNFTGYVYFLCSDPNSSINWKSTNFTSANQGIKTVSLPALVTAGDPYIEAYWNSNPAVNGAQSGINVTTASLSQIKISHPLKVMTAGQVIEPFTITPADAFNNPFPDVLVEVDVIQMIGSTPFQQHFSITSTKTGTAYTNPITILDKAKSVQVTASLPGYPGIMATKTYSVKGNIVVNVSLNGAVVEAGVPVGFTVTILNPDGTVATDFEGTVYVYGFSFSGYGGILTTYDTIQWPSTADAKWIAINFTAQDYGVKIITDGLIFLMSGTTQIGASTIPPENLDPQEYWFTLNWETLNGLSNEITILPSNLTQLHAYVIFHPDYNYYSGNNILNNNNAILEGYAEATDAFGNPVPDQLLQFDFWATGGYSSTAQNKTNFYGATQTYGPSLPVIPDSTVLGKVTVSAPGTNVPSYTAQRYYRNNRPIYNLVTINQSAPAAVFPNQNNQPVSDVSVGVHGRLGSAVLTNGFFEITFPIAVRGIGEISPVFSSNLPGIIGSGTTILGYGNFSIPGGQIQSGKYYGVVDNLEFSNKTYSADRSVLYVKLKNKTPLFITYIVDGQTYTSNNGTMSFSETDATYATSGLKIDVPEIPWYSRGGGEIIAIADSTAFSYDYRQSGRNNYSAATGIIAVLEDLREAMGDYSLWHSPWGNTIIMQDADNLANGLLVSSDYYLFPEDSPTFFRIEAYAANNPGLVITVQSYKKDGSAFMDDDGNILPESRYENLPLNNVMGPYLYNSEPLIAVSYYPYAQETVKNTSGTYSIQGTSVVRADGISKSEITVTLKDAQGMPIPNKNIQIVADGGAIFEPAVNMLTTDGNGIATVGLKSSERGIKSVTATIDGISLTAKILFIPNVIPILAESGGRIKVTCAGLSAANREKYLDVQGAEVYVKAEGETDYIPANQAVVQGTRPTIEIRLAQSYSLDGIFNPEDIALTIDDGNDETSAERSIDPSKRFIRIKDHPAEFTVSDYKSLYWTPITGTLKPGLNRIRVYWSEDSNYNDMFYGGYCLVTVQFTAIAPLNIGLQIVSGNNQEGLCGRCATAPLIVRAYNLDRPYESLEGIPLSFEVITGGGIFVEEAGYSSVTNLEGKGALHYHYSTTPGIKYVQVSVLGDPSVTPVEFHLEGYLPTIEIAKPLNVARDIKGKYIINGSFSGLGDILKVKVMDPRKNLPVNDVEVRWQPEFNGIFLPEIKLTNDQGEATFGFTSWGVAGSTLKAHLPEFIEPTTGESISDQIEIVSIPNSYLKVYGGQGQIGVANQLLKDNLIIFVDRWDSNMAQYISSNVTFNVKSGGGKIDGTEQSITKQTSSFDGRAYVTYTCGTRNEPQIIEVTDVSSTEKVYFVVGPPKIEFIKTDGILFADTEPLPVIDGNTLLLKAILEVWGEEPPEPMEIIDPKDEGWDSPGGGVVLTSPTIPSESFFKIRISNPTDDPGSIVIPLNGLNMCKASKDQIELELRGGIIPGYYVSTKPLLLYYGVFIDSLKIDLHSAFSDFILLNVEEVKIDFKGQPKKGTPIVPQIVGTKSPYGRGVYEYNTTVKLYGIIWSDIEGSWKPYHAYEGDVNAPDKFSNLGEVKRWNNTKYGDFAFTWKKITPKEDKSYSNVPPPQGSGKPWDKLDYTEVGILNETKWEYICHSPTLQKTITGVAYYALDVAYKDKVYHTPNAETRHVHPQNPKKPYDACISDKVMRIIVKGSYTQGNKDYLNLVAAHINAPWIYGSYWEDQSLRYIGYDCADMAMHAYQEYAGKLPEKVYTSKMPALDKINADIIWKWAGSKKLGIAGDYPAKFEAKNKPKPASEINESLLEPGNIILFGYIKENSQFKDKFDAYHTVVFVGHNNSGKLDMDDIGIFASSPDKKVTVRNFANFFGGTNYTHVVVIEVKK